MVHKIDLNFILCVDYNGGISYNNNIPWKFEEDSRYFRDIINHKYNNKPNLIIYGRNTFEKMGAIKNNINLIISTTQKYNDEINNIYSVTNIVDSIEFIDTNKDKFGKIFICGGSNVYNKFYNLVYNNRQLYNSIFYVTLIEHNFLSDNKISFMNLINKRKSIFYSVNKIHNGVELKCNNLNDGIEYNLIFLKPFDIDGNIIDIENKEEMKYLYLMHHLLESNEKISRNGSTLSDFGEQLKFKLDKFPLLTTKKLFFKGVFEELMFFIRGQTNAKILSEKQVKIWEGNTSKEFLLSQNLNYQEGDMGPMYGFQWRHFGEEYKGYNKEYNGGYDQLSYVLNEIKTNPNSRRIIMTTYNPAQAKQGVLFPCHGIGIVFNTSEIGIDNNKRVYELNCMQLQRSCDYFLGVPFNIASYSLLVYLICEVLNNDETCTNKYIPGNFILSLGDYHLYKSHINEARRQVIRTPCDFPQLIFKNKRKNIEEFELNDIEIINYNPHLVITASMVA